MTQPSDDWYRPDIPRKELKELMRRDDAPGLIGASQVHVGLPGNSD